MLFFLLILNLGYEKYNLDAFALESALFTKHKIETNETLYPVYFSIYSSVSLLNCDRSWAS